MIVGRASRLGAGLQRDEGVRHLAPFRVGVGDDGGFHHVGVAVERFLDLQADEMFSPPEMTMSLARSFTSI